MLNYKNTQIINWLEYRKILKKSAKINHINRNKLYHMFYTESYNGSYSDTKHTWSAIRYMWCGEKKNTSRGNVKNDAWRKEKMKNRFINSIMFIYLFFVGVTCSTNQSSYNYRHCLTSILFKTFLCAHFYALSTTSL